MSEVLKTQQDRLWQSIMDMAKIGPGMAGGSRRLALTDEDKAGRDLFVEWCEEAGLSISIDDMGNIFARRDGADNTLAPVVSGSHLDTQPHGGRFDGIYGVLATLEVIRTMNDHGIQTKAPVEIVMWTNEEGSRFAPAMIASGVYAGLFEKDFAYSRQDTDGKTLKDELIRIGYMGQETCGEHPIGALLEAHIEQGPILEKENKPVGVVVGGQGQRWFDCVISGQDSHAGSTPMPGRKDALVAASEIISGLQRLALENPPHAVATVGEMKVTPNSRNTIPGHVFFSIDLRHPEADMLDQLTEQVKTLCQQACDNQSCNLELTEIWHCPPVVFDQDCISAVRNAAATLGYAHMDMVSGAGHDACQVSRVRPTSMIFVPCEGGLSHNEAENATPEDLAAGCDVLLNAMIDLANR